MNGSNFEPSRFQMQSLSCVIDVLRWLFEPSHHTPRILLRKRTDRKRTFSHEGGQNCTGMWEVHCQYRHFNTTISKVRPIFKFLVYFGLIFSKTFRSMLQLIFFIHRIDLLEFWKIFEYFCRHLNRLLTNLKPHSNCYWPNLGTL